MESEKLWRGARLRGDDLYYDTGAEEGLLHGPQAINYIQEGTTRLSSSSALARSANIKASGGGLHQLPGIAGGIASGTEAEDYDMTPGGGGGGPTGRGTGTQQTTREEEQQQREKQRQYGMVTGYGFGSAGLLDVDPVLVPQRSRSAETSENKQAVDTKQTINARGGGPHVESTAGAAQAELSPSSATFYVSLFSENRVFSENRGGMNGILGDSTENAPAQDFNATNPDLLDADRDRLVQYDDRTGFTLFALAFLLFMVPGCQ
eukprot:g16825.t1